MNDWFRSLTVLCAGFAGVVAFTLGMAIVIVPDPVGSSDALEGAPSAVAATDEAPAPVVGAPNVVGGTLTVSGDQQVTFAVDHEEADGRYGLSGDDGRIYFAGDPLAVAQMSFNGLEFFPEPEECSITPGELNSAVGVATAELECSNIADVRGNGVVSVVGTLGLSGDVLGMRGDLPFAGGEVEVGDETLVFTEASLFVASGPVVGPNAFSQRIMASDEASWLSFDYDPNSGVLTLAAVVLDGDTFVDLGEGGCALTTQEIGQLNPRTTVVKQSFACPAVDVDGLGSVVVSGSLVVEQSTDR